MRNYSPRELRSAIVLAVILTAVAIFAIADPSCRPQPDAPPTGPHRSLAPR